MSSNYSLILVFFIILVLFSKNNLATAEEDLTNEIDILLEYRKVLSDDDFNTMLKIYTNNKVPPIEKERMVVDFISSLPQKVIMRIPVPVPFRSLPTEIQQKIKYVYYQKGVTYKRKLAQIRELAQNFLINKMQEERLKNNLIGFNVNVTLKLNGFFTEEALKEALTTEELQKLQEILSDNLTNNETKLANVGEFLRRVYNNRGNLGNWPPLHGMENFSDTDKQSVVQLLFGNKSTVNLAPLLEFYGQSGTIEQRKQL